MSIAGLYDTWIDADGKAVSTCTMITTSANALMADIHERMPVVLNREQERIWLDRANTNVMELTAMLQPYSAEQMHAYAVSNAVGNVRNNGAELIVPLVSAP